MQLRAARLCLDCEELHVEDTCPVCASDRFAYLSAWLPSEERRRWRRPATEPEQPSSNAVGFVTDLVAGWLGVERTLPRTSADHPLTRASDHVPDLSFGETRKEPKRRPSPKRHPAKSDAS